MKIVSEITFYLSLLCLLSFLVLASVGTTELTLVFLYLAFVFWGLNKVTSYFLGLEIRITYAVKISQNAPKLVRITALIVAVFITLYGGVELYQLNIYEL